MPIHSLYICFASMPQTWELQVASGDDWVTYCQGDTRYLHTVIDIPEGAAKVRILATSKKQIALSINEIFAFGQGDLPDWVQRWEPTHEKADILFISTHPDDELLFFAGAIPTYATEQQRNVVVAYFTPCDTTRSSELLNGLWHMGVRHYPVIGKFTDHYTKSVDAAYQKAGGRAKVLGWVTGLYRQYKPEVVVTHDTKGEYGHMQHRMIAQAAQMSIERAAGTEFYKDSLDAYGPWQIKKLYLHLWPEDQLIFDWTVPLASMNGKTGLELAIEAYALHVSQDFTGYSVETTGAEFDNRVFGLAYTSVGPDVRQDDFLENIYENIGSDVKLVP